MLERITRFISARGYVGVAVTSPVVAGKPVYVVTVRNEYTSVVRNVSDNDTVAGVAHAILRQLARDSVR